MEEIIRNILIASISIVIFWKLFIWQFWQLIRDDNNLNKAKKELPILSNELKLNYKNGDELGLYHGHWNKHQIRIEPNNYLTSINIKIIGDPQFSAIHRGVSEKHFDLTSLFHQISKIIIKFIPGYQVAESEYPKFNIEEPQLDKYFQNRLLLGKRGKDIAHDSGLQNVIKDFLEKNCKIVKNLIIGAEVSCSLWIGSSSTKARLYSVTGRQVKHMLSEMLPIVEELERALKY